MITNETPTIGPNGELQRLSVSTLKKGKECLRRFFINKKLHVPEPVFKAQQVGIDGHAQLEHFVKTGEDVLGPLARSAKHLLPPGDVPVAPELELKWSLDDVPVLGFADLVTSFGLGRMRVTDYKFVGNPKDARFNAQEPKDLVDVHDSKGHGIQMVGYAVAISERYRTDTIEVEHIQIGTKKREARSILATIEPKVARERWNELTPLVRSMKDAAKADRWEDVPATWTACARCPFRDTHCFATFTTTKETNMGILNRLGVKTAAPLPPPPAATGELNSSATPPPVAASAPVSSSVNGSAGVASASKGPDSDLSATQNTPAPIAEVLAKAPVDPEPVTPTEAAAIAEAKVEEKPKRARKPRVEVIGQTPGGGTVLTYSEDVQKAAAEMLATNPEPAPLRIFVDCVPNTVVLDLDFYIAELVAQVAKTGGVDDLRFVTEKSHPFAYGNWKGALAIAARKAPPAAGDYVVRSDSEFAQIVIEALKPTIAPGNFVRGVR